MRPVRAVRLLAAVAIAVATLAAPAYARPALDESTVTLTSSAPNAPHGQMVTFTATVTGAGACAPALGESVAFSIDGSAVATAQLSVTGQATYATSTLDPGQHTVVAEYDGDANCASSTATLTQQIADVGTTLTTLVASVGSPASGTAVLFTATVTGTGSPCVTPTGVVTFTETTGGTSQYLGSAPLGATRLGEALFGYVGFASGVHTVVASYNGDANCAASASGAASVTVVGSGPPIIGAGGQGATTPAYSGAPITILTGVGSPATQALYRGCTAVSLFSVAGTPLAVIATLVSPPGNVTGIWRYDAATKHYQAGYLATPGAPLDFTTTNGGQETYAVCTAAGGAIRSSS